MAPFMTIPLIAVLIFLGLNVFFVLAEFALVRANAPRLEIMQSNGVSRAGLVLRMIRNLDSYLSAIQIGITMCTLGMGWLGEPAASRVVRHLFENVPLAETHAHAIGTVISFLVIMYLQVVFAELVPRNIAIQKAEDIALWTAYPLELYKRAVKLPNAVLTRSSIFLSRLLGFSPAGEAEQVFSEDEMRAMLGVSQEKGLLPLDRLLLIENLFDLSTLKVRDAMVPRDRIVFVSTAKSTKENLEIIKKNHFSRYPLAEPDLDHVTGYIHTKDWANAGDEVNLTDIKRKFSTVQDSDPLQPLLKMMATQGKPLMLAMRGPKLSGLISLEDILEEVVGEVHDEFDAPLAWSLQALMSPELIDLDVKGATPEECVTELAARVQAAHGVDPRAVVQAVVAREAQLPTAIGKGVAVPHARLPTVSKPIVAVGRSNRGVSFPTPDKIPVRLVFLILTPAAAPLEQLRILSRVATLVNNDTLRRRLFRARTAAQFLDLVRTSEPLVAG